MDRPSDDAASKPTLPELTSSPQPTAQDNSLAREPAAKAPLPRDLLDVSLELLSTSNNETLLGVFGLLAVGTYIILGRIGLLLIGVALGVLLHASWEGPSHASHIEESRTPKKRRELALEVSKRLLDWPKRAPQTVAGDENEGSALGAPEDLLQTDLEYATFRPATAAALRSLTDAVIQDYVKYWYEPILPSEAVFPSSCRRTLTHFVTAVSSHLARKRTEDMFLQFLTNSSSIIIVFLNELAAAFAAGSLSTDAKTIVGQYLESSPDSSLANVLSPEQQRKKLNMIAEDILSNFLDSKAYRCPPVRDFLREVFSGIVLESTVTSLSRPEFINDWIIYLLQDGESEIMHAIDAGVEGARNQGVSDAKVPDVPKETAFSATESHAPQADKATEDAIQEAKRLSVLIASQDVQPGPTEPSAESSQPQEIPSHDQDVKSNIPVSPEAPSVPSPREDTTVPVSLHGALVMVDDGGAGNEKTPIRSRPTWDYLLQVEPASTRSTGWMVFRKYADFQSLHETLETVARLNRIQGFSEQFPTLPVWKAQTRQGLARDLERYLQTAMKHEPLAETERMRRFLEKERGGGEASPAKLGFSFPNQAAFESMGKGVLGALTNAPKGVAGGGRAVFDGVTGVFGGAGHSRKPTNTSDRPSQHRTSTSTSRDSVSHDLSRVDSATASLKLDEHSVTSEGRESPALVSSPTAPDLPSKLDISKSPVTSETGSGANLVVNEQDAWASESTLAQPEERRSPESINRIEPETAGEDQAPASPQLLSETVKDAGAEPPAPDVRRQQNPITADETQIAVELIFAVINELYTLSSAWNIRRTLLNAAKSYILRPGSPTLETIRTLLQDSMIESHTSDDALGEYLAKLRENALPTEAELKAWPAPPSEEEKARLRDTARRLFVQRGIPQALTSVMGAAASREALEKIFDSLQVETVARGFVFSVMLQGLRVLTL